MQELTINATSTNYYNYIVLTVKHKDSFCRMQLKKFFKEAWKFRSSRLVFSSVFSLRIADWHMVWKKYV